MTYELEQAASQIVNTAFTASNMLSWSCHTGISNQFISYPLVKVICEDFTRDYKESKIPNGKARLSIVCAGMKHNMKADAFNSGSNAVIDPFFYSNIEGTMMSYLSNISIQGMYDSGLEQMVANDGWVVKQNFEIVCHQTS